MNTELKEMDYNERFNRLERQIEDYMLLMSEQTRTRLDVSHEPIDMDPNKRLDRLEWMTENLIHLMSNEESQTQEQKVTVLDLVIEIDPKEVQEIFEIQPWSVPVIPNNGDSLEQVCHKGFFQGEDPLPNQDSLLGNKIFDNQILDNSRQQTSRIPTQLTTLSHRTTFIFCNTMIVPHKKQELIELFREYVKSKGQIHKNRLDFYFACEGLKQQTDSTTITNMILSIYRFLLKNKIKVPDEVRSSINRTLKSGSPKTDVFDPILEIVENVICATTYEDFCGTDIFLKCVDKSLDVTPLPVTSFPITNVSTTQKDVEFAKDLRLIRFTRYKFPGNVLIHFIGNTENVRHERIIYIRNRHLEWEAAWKKNFDQFKYIAT